MKVKEESLKADLKLNIQKTNWLTCVQSAGEENWRRKGFLGGPRKHECPLGKEQPRPAAMRHLGHRCTLQGPQLVHTEATEQGDEHRC